MSYNKFNIQCEVKPNFNLKTQLCNFENKRFFFLCLSISSFQIKQILILFLMKIVFRSD